MTLPRPIAAALAAPGATVIVAAISCLGTVVLAAMILAGLQPVLDALPDGPQIGAVLLLSTLVRVFAGAAGARSIRRVHGLPTRTAALPPVVLGAVIGWLGYVLLVLLTGGAGIGRLALELVRWGAEVALGAYLITPDDDLDAYADHGMRGVRAW